MKKGILILLLAVGTVSFAQTNPYPKTITVSGSSEMEVVPDEIYVNVLLREYEKKGQGKVSIDKIKSDFLSAVRATGVADSLISIAAYDGYQPNPWIRKKQKKEELYASITYQLKLKNSKQIDDIVNRLDDQATQNFYIQRTTHSKLEEYKKQLKIQAVKDAKEKAIYLAEAINERVGEAVTINEPMEYNIYYPQVAMMSRDAKQEMSGVSEEAQVDFRKIKLKYNVNVVFALK